MTHHGHHNGGNVSSVNRIFLEIHSCYGTTYFNNATAMTFVLEYDGVRDGIFRKRQNDHALQYRQKLPPPRTGHRPREYPIERYLQRACEQRDSLLVPEQGNRACKNVVGAG